MEHFIDEQRSGTCREFILVNARRDKVRQQQGLAPLGAEALAWQEIPPRDPHATIRFIAATFH
ncbi:hypothetical protein [Azohydromonas australica]|uniref:hypothetical protein n=1 Tax=Azohydromonas australica TaxID=364039 RepID=UPI0004019351|nr:hypothetical protein [Azohydromonas australica]